MVTLVFILIAGILLVVLGAFVKRCVESFGCLILGFILIAYSVVYILMEVEALEKARWEKQQSSGLSLVWRGPKATVQQRAAAVNRAFTNGTLVSVVVAASGTNYTRNFNSAHIWIGSGPEPPNTYWLSYRFGEDEVAIGTSAVFGGELDPLNGKFTGAGYSLPAVTSQH